MPQERHLLFLTCPKISLMSYQWAKQNSLFSETSPVVVIVIVVMEEPDDIARPCPRHVVHVAVVILRVVDHLCQMEVRAFNTRSMHTQTCDSILI